MFHIEAPSTMGNFRPTQVDGPRSFTEQIFDRIQKQFRGYSEFDRANVFPPPGNYLVIESLLEHYTGIYPQDFALAFVKDRSTDSNQFIFRCGFYSTSKNITSQDGIVVSFARGNTQLERIRVSQNGNKCDCIAWRFDLGASQSTPESFSLRHWTVDFPYDQGMPDVVKLLKENQKHLRDVDISINHIQTALFPEQQIPWEKLEATFGFKISDFLPNTNQDIPTLETMKSYIFASFRQPLPSK
jgi:hypothetical protein